MNWSTLLKRSKLLFLAAFAPLLLAGCSRSQFLVFDPKGPVGKTEMDLIIFSVVLCAIVIIPVLFLLVYIVYRYRDKPGNTAPYQPEWADSKVLEIIWWGIPIIIIGVLGFYTAKTTFALTKPPTQNVKPITVQVTNLDWKWLFTYPGQKIGTVNYAEIPTGTPVQFVLTSDAPMNSFWVPQLGGMEYTMPGMAMGLWLQADKPGTYFGSGASFTGAGFAHMQFQVVAKPEAEFNQWVDSVKKSAPALTEAGYKDLAKQGLAQKQDFGSIPDNLFENIVLKNGGKYYPHHMDNMKMSNDQTNTTSTSMNMKMDK